MSLVEHARRELEIAGLFKPDSDYDGAIGEAVMTLIKAFSEQGHSGFSAHMTLDVFGRVARFKTLTPLTDNLSEWDQVSPDMTPGGTPTVWQSLRQCSCFSTDGGKTYYDLDAGTDNLGRIIQKSEPHQT